MRVLLTGASGLLGRAILAGLRGRRDIELTGTAFSRARTPVIKADLTDPAEVGALFAAAKPDFVIHAAAERRPDIVDRNPSQARALNVAATETVARACAKSGAFLLYISTDYVFDGSNPPYFPDSPVNPLNEYGRLKLEGEARVAAMAAAKAAILRLPILYGPVERLDESAVTELASLLKKGQACRVDNWARRYPLHVDDVAAAIEKIIDATASRSGGPTAGGRGAVHQSGLPIYLLSGPVAYTKYEMLAIMAKILGMDASFAAPDAAPSKGAPRPKDCRMDTTLIEALGYKPRVDFESGIADALAPFFKG